MLFVEARLPKHPTRAHLLELAKHGAQAQLSDLLHEMRMILELFPDLRDSFDADELPVRFLLKRGATKRQMSAAARARISAAQKKRWAKQKNTRG